MAVALLLTIALQGASSFASARSLPCVPRQVMLRNRGAAAQRPRGPELRATAAAVQGGQRINNNRVNNVESPRPPISVLALLFSAFLNLLGFTMAGPITPALAKHFSLAHGSRIGMLTSAYPCGMLVGLVIWPLLSDREHVGRKRVIVGSLFGSGLGLALQAACLALRWPLWSFLALRALSGASAGSSPVTKALLADLAPRDDLPRWLAYREASATLAFIVGPCLGGLLYFGSASLAAVVASTAIGSLAAAATVALLVDAKKAKATAPAPAPAPSAGSSQQQPSGEEKEDEELELSCPLGVRMGFAVATIVTISALENAGASCWDAFGAVMLQERFALEARSIGALFTTLAAISLAVSMLVFDRVRKATGLVATNVIGLAFIAVGLAGVGSAETSLVAFLGATALYQVGKPLYAPSVPTLLLKCVPPHRRGLAMGADAFVNTLARTIAPIALGNLMTRRGASAAFAAAAGLVATAATVSTVRGIQVAAANARAQKTKNR